MFMIYFYNFIAQNPFLVKNMTHTSPNLNVRRTFFMFVFLTGSLSAFSQDAKTEKKTEPVASATTTDRSNTTSAPVNVRTASTSVKIQVSESAELPYNVDDKYMGRAESFKQLFKSNELPPDFPIYEKQYGWGIREYNAVVGAYLENNKHLLTDKVLEKLNSGKK